MLGGFNKLMRNIVAGASDTEFEKVNKIISYQTFVYIEADKRNFPHGQQRAKRETCDL